MRNKTAEDMRDYQTEVLNKCAGRTPGSEHPKVGLLYRIGEQVPYHVIHDALGWMQDARNNNLNMDKDMKYISDLEAYYFKILSDMCNRKGIITCLRS